MSFEQGQYSPPESNSLDVSAELVDEFFNGGRIAESSDDLCDPLPAADVDSIGNEDGWMAEGTSHVDRPCDEALNNSYGSLVTPVGGDRDDCLSPAVSANEFRLDSNPDVDWQHNVLDAHCGGVSAGEENYLGTTVLKGIKTMSSSSGGLLKSNNPMLSSLDAAGGAGVAARSNILTRDNVEDKYGGFTSGDLDDEINSLRADVGSTNNSPRSRLNLSDSSSVCGSG